MASQDSYTYINPHRDMKTMFFKLLFVKNNTDFYPNPFLQMKTFKLKLDFYKQGEKNELSFKKPYY